MDEALIILWDAGFDDIAGPSDLLSRGSANRARRALGIATRRERASPEYWQGELQLDDEGLAFLLDELGVAKPFAGGQLSKKAIHRLSSELRARGRAPRETGEARDGPSPEPDYPPFSWEAIGHPRDCRHLSEDEVRSIHFLLVEDFSAAADPIEPAGVRSESLLGSAVYRSRTSISGVPKYPTVEMAAAALLHALVHDHPFHNGNKRTGLVSMLVFLDENGLILTCDEDALFKLVLQLAQHALVRGSRSELPDREMLAVANWLKDRSRILEKGDRPLPWRRLQRILSAYGCKFEHPTAGNRINISRKVAFRSRFWGRPRRKILSTQTFYGDEGREVERNTINMIRHQLHLDDEHGIDSRAFYENDAVSPSDFIIRYRKTLRRLAKL